MKNKKKNNPDSIENAERDRADLDDAITARPRDVREVVEQDYDPRANLMFALDAFRFDDGDWN
jgi:hypothetical protein